MKDRESYLLDGYIKESGLQHREVIGNDTIIVNEDAFIEGLWDDGRNSENNKENEKLDILIINLIVNVL